MNLHATPAPTSDVPTGRIVLVAATAALGGFLFGYDTAVINGAVGAIGSRFGVDGVVLGFTVASALLGCAVGAWYAGRVADRYGRIRVMLIAAVLFVVSSIGCGLAFSVWDLSVWRIVGGLGVGAASVIAPAYIAEVSPPHLRGRLGSLQQLAIVSGIFVALLVDFGIVALAGSASAPWLLGLEAWRWMFVSEVVPAVLYGVLALTIPESPRFLVSKGRTDEAKEVLRRFVGGDIEVTTASIQVTYRGQLERPKLDVLRAPSGGLLPIVWIGIALSILQQFTGINVIFYYSSVLWQAVGFSEQDSLVITVITSVTNIVTTIVAIMLVDRVGRKPLLFVGAIGQFVSLGTLAVVFATAPIVGGQPMLEGAAGPIALVAANLFVVFFGCSWGPVVWVLLGEMFSNRIRAIALSVAAAAQWIANFVISTTFPVLSSIGLGVAYGVYTLFAFVAVLFVWRFITETKGKALEDMDD
ncbi:sugar porter family MFS transporter [Pseudoclavibacter chungangensis]|uniref:Sugar porter family MFS transporter n=1 Tax=Pseudoclavibacter chungangensis TaxID=587635 RepID=A0A7J5BYL5_9MICO|nr:sugar porter family MFS transporter [Pseudoclavibacter chungangensis]KAB1659432.1 sugar porter family MFS transporter [Pseudoclavibacter chungangensis]NYJ67720.1 SP family sugar:H+ symporter-like MFS transporter [Pseudoclavibacter chungangensis]